MAAPSPPPPARLGSPPGRGSTAELAGKLTVSQALVGVSTSQTVADVSRSGPSKPADPIGVFHLIALTSFDCLDAALLGQDTTECSPLPVSPFSDLHVAMQTSSA